MSWFPCKLEHCQYCGSEDFDVGVCEPRTLLICECCQYAAAHIECEESKSGVKLSQETLSSGHTWYCSKECEKINTELLACLGKRTVLGGNYSLEISSATAKKGRGAVDAAKRLLKSCFDPLIMDNGMDLIDMMCSCYESPEDADEDTTQYNLSTFKVAVLRKGANCVSAGVIRVFGAAFAEMPFVATRDGYRREGNLRRLLQAVESKLAGLGVRRLVVQSVRALLPMWMGSLGFLPLTLAEADSLDPLLISPDPESAQLIKKNLLPGVDRSGAPLGAPTAPLSPATAIFGPDAAAAAPGGSAAAATAAPSAQQHVQHGKGSPVAQPAQLLGKGRAPEQELTAAAHAAAGLALRAAAASEPPSAAASAASQGHEGGSEAAAPGAAAPQAEERVAVPELGEGWTKIKHFRPSGRHGWIFHAPGGRTFRSKKQAQAHAHVLQGKQPVEAPSNSPGKAPADACAAEGSQQMDSKLSPAKRAGLMLPPPPRPPKHAKSRAGAGPLGVPLLPNRERARCQGRQLDKAVAHCLAEAVQRFIKGAAEESLGKEQQLQSQIDRLLEENRKLKQAFSREKGNNGSAPVAQPSVPGAQGQTLLAGTCSFLDAAIQRISAA